MTPANLNQSISTLRWPRWALDLVSAPMRARPSAVIAWVGAMVVVFTSLTYLVGGTSSLPPHWFYLPIVIAGARFGVPGARFGVPGALVVAVASGLLVGPVMPADVIQGTAQETSDWLTRTFFFAGIGAMVTALMRQATRGIERERRQIASARRLDEALQHGQLHLHFQPIVSATTGEVTGAEGPPTRPGRPMCFRYGLWLSETKNSARGWFPVGFEANQRPPTLAPGQDTQVNGFVVNYRP